MIGDFNKKEKPLLGLLGSGGGLGYLAGRVSDVADLLYTISNSGVSFTLRSVGTVNYTVNWGDGSSETSTSNTLAHTYSSSGTYIVKINSNSGTYRPRFDESGDEDQITSVEVSVEDSSLFGTDIQNAFRGAQNMTEYTQVAAATSAVTSFTRTWQGCSGLTSFPLIDVTSGTTFSATWAQCSGFTEFPVLDFSSATNIFAAWNACTGITTFPTIDTSSVTNFGAAWISCSGLTTFPVLDTSSGTSFDQTWRECSGLTSFPQIDPSSVTNFNSAWRSCSGITTFPSLDFSSGTNFVAAWRDCTSLTTYPADQFDTTGTLTSTAFNNTWLNCALTAQSIENILTSLDINGQQNITLSIDGGQNANASTWSTDTIIAYRNLINKGWTITKSGTPSMSDLEYTISNSGTSFTLRAISTVNYTVDWGDGSALETSTSTTLAHTYSSSGTYVVKINSNSGAYSYRPKFDNSGDEDQITSIAVGFEDSVGFYNNIERAFRGAQNMTKYNQVAAATSAVADFERTWENCSGLTEFPLIDTSSGTNFTRAWISCSGLTSFPLIDTSSGTNFSRTWRDCTGLTSFPLIDTSNGIYFTFAWSGCSGLTTFPLINTSSATDVGQAWNSCSNLVAFPALDFSNVTVSLRRTWYFCTSLTTFPANMFDNINVTSSNGFQDAFRSCALTAQSIENILVSLDTNGASNIELGIHSGNNAGKTTWSTAANTAYTNLINKGWTISYNP